MQARTRTAKCGCTETVVRDRRGDIVSIDEAMCEEHATQAWEKAIITPNIPIHTVHLSDEQQARMKDLMEELG